MIVSFAGTSWLLTLPGSWGSRKSCVFFWNCFSTPGSKRPPHSQHSDRSTWTQLMGGPSMVSQMLTNNCQTSGSLRILRAVGGLCRINCFSGSQQGDRSPGTSVWLRKWRTRQRAENSSWSLRFCGPKGDYTAGKGLWSQGRWWGLICLDSRSSFLMHFRRTQHIEEI